MDITVLGCNGAIGGRARTTSFLVDGDILIDAGTGVGDLDLDAMAAIEHVFLTHSHFDHIANLPLMLDAIGDRLENPVVIHALPETILTLREHLFNWKLWPDFTAVPTPDRPFAILEEMQPGEVVEIKGRKFRSIPVEHTVPAVGYLVSSDSGSLAFSGDTAPTEEFWRVLNACDDLQYVVIETTFEDSEKELAGISKHLCPQTIARELQKLESDAEVFITHLMPGQEKTIMREIAEHHHGTMPKALTVGHVFSLQA
ncbi:MAG: 3',5'-cyclic-nucleotide phosphodiesterase [Gammaproteobacteria bacterium]|nr:3',5'-cyclic-nucleotide phosphodiesterase [Gammaproteobacteria bacterium]